MKQILSMIVFVLVLGSILTTALVGIDKVTAPRIEVNELRKVHRGVLNALGISFEKGLADPVFEKNVTSRELGGKSFYVTADGAVAFEVTGAGLWGPIDAVIALAPDRKTIQGISVVRQEETPGLGGRIGEKEYLATFRGKEIVPQLRIVGEGKANAKNEVDGITGATLSCKAFEVVLNAGAAAYMPLLEGADK